jgi:hypothetical protein
VTAAVRRDWLERVGPLDESLIGADDYEYWLRIAFAGGRFGLAQGDLGIRILNERSLSCRPMLTLTSQLRCLRTYRDLHPACREAFDRRIEQSRGDVIRAAVQTARTETAIGVWMSALRVLRSERCAVPEFRRAWAVSRPRPRSHLRSSLESHIRRNRVLRAVVRRARTSANRGDRASSRPGTRWHRPRHTPSRLSSSRPSPRDQVAEGTADGLLEGRS